jgi:hypothetical protein
VLIEENAHTYIIICVCIVFLKKSSYTDKKYIVDFRLVV